MQSYRLEGLHQAQETLLGFFASCTGCAIGLYEPTEEGRLIESHTFGQYELYCSALRSLPEGEEWCHQYHEERARQALKSKQEGLAICHAGVFNQIHPVIFDGKVMAILAYGQMRIRDHSRYAEATQLHQATMTKLGANPQAVSELRRRYSQIKELTEPQVRELALKLSTLQQWLGGVYVEEVRVDKYTRNVIHDLHTWLQPILNGVEDLNDRLNAPTRADQDEEFRRLAQNLLHDVLRMRFAIWNVGTFALDYRFETLDLAELIDEAARLYMALADRRHIEIRTVLKKPYRVRVARTQLQHAINNVLHNTVKYSLAGTSERPRLVNIRGMPVGRVYELAFANHGVGVLPDEFERVFEPNYQGVLTRGEHREGAGMGLAIAREIIQRHGGTIALQSCPAGDGAAYLTEIIMRLPFD
jgi:signal transduction histidine kinase